MSDNGPYYIEISNDECVFLYYSLEVMKQAISSSIPYDTAPYKVGLEDAVKYINSVLGIRDKAMENARRRRYRESPSIYRLTSQKNQM